VISQIIAFAIAIPLALLAGRRPNKRLDRYSTTPRSPGSPPAFILARARAHLLRHCTSSGTGLLRSISQSLSANLNSMILPSIILAIARSSCTSALAKRSDRHAAGDFITMAARRHDRPAHPVEARLPAVVVSLLASAGSTSARSSRGPSSSSTAQIPGLGYELVTAINQTDYIVVQSIVLVVAIAVVIINFIVDFLFSVVDPRMS